MWAVLSFEISFGKIFANDAEEKELDAAKEHDNTDKARPAGGRIAKSESFDNYDDNDDESNKTKDDAEKGGNGKRNSREGNDALDGVFEKLPKGPGGLAGDALDVFVFDPFGFEANKTPKAFGIAVVFLTGNDGVNHLAGHQAIIAGAVDHFDIAHAVDELVENAGKKAADGRFAFAGDTAGGGTIYRFWCGVLVGWVDVFEEFGEEAGRILAIGVHGGNEIAASVFEASEESGFFTEIARERDVEDARVVTSERFNDFERVVAATIVDKNKFKIVVRQGVDNVESFLIKEGKCFGFVVTGNYNTNLFLHCDYYSMNL